MKRPLPAGLDQQGRYETRPFGPAEASTEIGADEPSTATSGRRMTFYSVALPAYYVVAAIALFALLAIHST